VRVANHPVTRLLCSLSGVGLAATSANLSGDPPPASVDTAPQEWRDLTGLVVLDGGPIPAAGESTVVDARGGRLRVLREGLIHEPDLVR
jgi:L-threonylcarbamoyladenylate synthase